MPPCIVCQTHSSVLRSPIESGTPHIFFIELVMSTSSFYVLATHRHIDCCLKVSTRWLQLYSNHPWAVAALYNSATKNVAKNEGAQDDEDDVLKCVSKNEEVIITYDNCFRLLRHSFIFQQQQRRGDDDGSQKIWFEPILWAYKVELFFNLVRQSIEKITWRKNAFVATGEVQYGD